MPLRQRNLAWQVEKPHRLALLPPVLLLQITLVCLDRWLTHDYPQFAADFGKYAEWGQYAEKWMLSAPF